MNARDKEILRAEVADKIAQLLPMTRLGLGDWRTTFEKQVVEYRAKANGCPTNSDAQREYLGWSNAHKIILDDDALKGV